MINQLQGHISKLSHIQEVLLEYLDSESNSKADFDHLYKDISNIRENKYDFRSFLHLISNISEYHFRNQHFISKIEQILTKFQKFIQNYFKNIEIYNIFKYNKLVLSYLIKKNIITLDNEVYDKIKPRYYMDNYYFTLEISEENVKEKVGDKETFEQNRKIGENHFYLCKLIREDLINEFDTFVNENEIEMSETIPKSVFETNSFIQYTSTTLIEYAAFFGSIKIFKYLYEKEVKVEPSLLYYAIHGQNQEILDFLLKNTKMKINYEECIIKSILFHNNKAALLFKDLMKKDIKDKTNILLKCIESYNFVCLTNKISDGINIFNALFQNKIEYQNKIFLNLCKYDYLYIVDFLLNIKDIKIDVNEILFNNINSI